MKKILSIIICAVMLVACLTACTPVDSIDKVPESPDGKYQIAFITDVGQLLDKSFNQGTWEGVVNYAKTFNETAEEGAKKYYKYYQPANGDKATDTDRYDAMKAAIDNGAEILVCAGFMQEAALRQAANEHPEIKFVFIDGYPVTKSADDSTILTNIAPISFQEEQSGYLAGYAAVKEGYTKLGFSGGGGGGNPACCRFGYGFVQGAEAAAKEADVAVSINYSWLHGASFSASDELQTMLNGWYSNGTEVVFACGGQMCKSAFAAASANNGKVIGVDVDQSPESETVITSATKGLQSAVKFALDKFYDGKFDDIGGTDTKLGATDDAVGLPTDGWKLTKFSVSEYNELLGKIKDGSVVVDADYTKLETATYEKVTVNIVK